MTLEVAIKTRLDAHAGLGNHVAGRVYAVERPQDTDFPCIVFESISEQNVPAMGSDPALTSVRLRCHVFADSTQSMFDTDEQLKAALRRFRGTSGGVVVQDIFNLTYNDNPQPKGRGRFHRARDFRVWFEET